VKIPCFFPARLVKLKAEHEKGAAPIDDRFAERAAQLLISQTVGSANQSGGITAHTINADTINLHPAPILGLGAGAPDWSIQELFYYLRPSLSPNGPREVWDEAGGEVLEETPHGFRSMIRPDRLRNAGRSEIPSRANCGGSFSVYEPR